MDNTERKKRYEVADRTAASVAAMIRERFEHHAIANNVDGRLVTPETNQRDGDVLSVIDFEITVSETYAGASLGTEKFKNFTGTHRDPNLAAYVFGAFDGQRMFYWAASKVVVENIWPTMGQPSPDFRVVDPRAFRSNPLVVWGNTVEDVVERYLALQRVLGII